MRFTQRSARWRRQLERKKKLIEILGGKVAATHSSAEVPMRQALPVQATNERDVTPNRVNHTCDGKPRTQPAGKFRAPDPNAARLAFRRRWLETEARR